MDVSQGFRCLRCGRKVAEVVNWRCPHCGATLEYQLEVSKPVFSGPLGLWRYRSVLPRVEKQVTLGEGGTPLQRSTRLAESLGYSNLYLKDETRNPTNSYKDRSAALIVSDAVTRGYDSLVCATSGNHGASLAAYCAKVDLECNLLVPRRLDMGKLAQMLAYDASVVEAGETIEEAIQRAVQLAEETGWYQATSELNPLSVEGVKTISYEVVEQLGVAPDYVVAAMGSGMTIHAIWKGFQELRELGLTERLPALVGVQSEGCAPIVEAYKRGESKPLPLEQAETEASAIRVQKPLYGEYALKALRESHGFAVTVSDQEMLEASRELARNEGIFAETASSAPVASLVLEEVRGRVGGDALVVCLVTSSGLKIDDVLRYRDKHRRSPGLGGRLATKERILRLVAEGTNYGYAIWRNLGLQMTTGAVYQHLNDLERRGLIAATKVGKRKELVLTERGRRVLEALDELQALL